MIGLSELASCFLSCAQYLTAFVLGYVLYVLVERKIRNLPPGPWGLPIVGYLPFIRGQLFRQLRELSNKYGNVIRLNLFGANVIVLNSYDAIKECYHNKGEAFSGRIIDKKSLFTYVTDGLGFLQEEGPVWREHRRFALHTLRDFGFGKLSLEGRVQEIGDDLIKGLVATNGKAYNPTDLLANAAFNVILYLTTDKHFQPDDPVFKMIRRNVRVILGRAVGITAFVSTPIMKIIPMEWQPGYSALKQIKTEFHEMSLTFIEEHQKTYQENNLRDFVDAFIAERNTELAEGNKDTTFIVDRLKILLINMLLAGTETTSNSLYWALKLLISKPEIQKKIQKELDEVVGGDRLPSIMDRANLPYTEAFILELFRYATIAPLGIPHSNPAEATLNGYNIPARSVILANLWAVHNDPEFWENPEEFNPDRFMVDPEKRTKRRERVVPFSIGKRSCLGESLARMELFLFLTMLLQKFTFKLPEGDSPDLKEGKSFVRVLQPYQICALPRTI